MKEIKTKDKFKDATEEQVRAALDDPNPHNALAREVVRLFEGYTANFAEHCQRIGGIPEKIVRATPATAIERVAMELMDQAIKLTIQSEIKGRAH